MSTRYRIQQVDADGDFVALCNFALENTAEQIRHAWEVALKEHLHGGAVIAVPVPDGAALISATATTPDEHENGFAHLLDNAGQRAHLAGSHHLSPEQIDGQPSLADVHTAEHRRRP